MFTKLDDAIGGIAYILDSLVAYRSIVRSGCCNSCKYANPPSCGYLPTPGKLVRYNCPFYKPKEGEG